MKTLTRKVLDTDLLEAMLTDCETIKPNWSHARVTIRGSGYSVTQNQQYKLTRANALFVKNLDGCVYLEHLRMILKTDTLFDLSIKKDHLVLKTANSTSSLKVQPVRESDMLLPVALEVPQETEREDKRAKIIARYAWLETIDPMYKSTIHNGRVNLAHELAALDAINVTSEFETITRKEILLA